MLLFLLGVSNKCAKLQKKNLENSHDVKKYLKVAKGV